MKQLMNFVINLCNFIRSLVILNIRIIPFEIGISDCGRCQHSHLMMCWRFSFQRLEHPIVLSGLILTFIETTFYIHKEQYLHGYNVDNYDYWCWITKFTYKMLSDFIGCKATSSRKKIEDSLVLNVVCVWGNWNHSLDCRGGTSQLYCTRCSLDLLVLCNVDCDCRRSILFG
ncbi:unnamed protein product [Schistosoma intercalatum]|nr:unnamed protein product [Schistosoma intercalatum]